MLAKRHIDLSYCEIFGPRAFHSHLSLQLPFADFAAGSVIIAQPYLTRDSPFYPYLKYKAQLLSSILNTVVSISTEVIRLVKLTRE